MKVRNLSGKSTRSTRRREEGNDSNREFATDRPDRGRTIVAGQGGGGEFDFREIIGGMLGNNVLVEHSSLTTTNYGLSPSVLAEETRNIEGVSLPSAALRIECFWNSVRNSSEYRFACSRTLIAVEYVCWTSIKVNRFHATYLYSSTFSSTHARAHTYSRIQQLSLT